MRELLELQPDRTDPRTLYARLPLKGEGMITDNDWDLLG
jgi:hypothetical protein